MYKVDYYTLAQINDGSIGNIAQNYDTAYMDCTLDNIQKKLNNNLAEKKRVAVVTNIKKIKGHILK